MNILLKFDCKLWLYLRNVLGDSVWGIKSLLVKKYDSYDNRSSDNYRNYRKVVRLLFNLKSIDFYLYKVFFFLEV